MAIYKFTDGRKGYYFSFYYQGKKIKKERWNGQRMESKADAIKCEFECKQQLEKFGNADNITLYDLYDEFIESSKANLKASTIANYKKFKRNYLTLINDQPIKNLKPQHFLNWKNKIKELDLTTDYKNRILKIMLSVLNYGNLMYELQGKLQFSLLEPFRDLKVAVIEHKTKYIPRADFERLIKPLREFIELDNNLYYYTVIKVLYNTGLRIGELTALELDDIKDNCIYITKDYIRVDGNDIIQAPKNQNSIRKVQLDSETIELLNQYIDSYQPKRLLFGLNGKYLTQQRIREIITKLAKETGLDEKYDVTPHNLRHSHASNLRALGFDEIIISKRLGNTPKVSATIYIHTDENEQLKIVEKMENLKK
jgi:integrase